MAEVAGVALAFLCLFASLTKERGTVLNVFLDCSQDLSLKYLTAIVQFEPVSPVMIRSYFQDACLSHSMAAEFQTL